MSDEIKLRAHVYRRGGDPRDEIHRTNEPGTCLWCGKKLRKSKIHNGAFKGDYSDNAFCGLRCGYSFGVTFASLGRRLKETE